MAWYDLTSNPKVVHGYYSAAPALDHMDLQGVRLHNNGPVLYLSAYLTPFPDIPSKRWPAGANTAQIDIAIWGVRSLAIEGWVTSMPGVFTLEQISEHRFQFRFLSDASSIRGECLLVRIDGITGYVTRAEQVAAHEPPPPFSGPGAPVHRTLDSLPAPGSGGGR